MFIAEGFREPPSQDYGAAIARFYGKGTVAGTGFLISEHYLLTCAHVVSQCLGLGKNAEDISTTAVKDKKLEIDFPVDVSGQRQTVEVVPELWRVGREDIAVLKLAQPLPSRVAVITLNREFPYWNHPFAVYGFPKKRPDGRWVDGKFLGSQPGIDRVQMEGTRSEGLGIEPGFSGSPVWNQTLRGVVGMVVARDTEEAAKISFMIPYEKLKPALEAIALFHLLLPEADSLVPYWKAAYRFLRPEISTEHSAKTLQEAIVQVQDMTSRNSTYRAIEQFIGYLALPELGLLMQPSLIQWLQKQVKDIDDLLALVRQNVAAQKEKQPETLAPHLLVWVQEEQNSDRFFAQAYLILNREQYNPETQVGVKQLQDLAQLFEEDEKVGQTQLEEVLQICLNESVEKIEQEQEQEDLPPLRVEVFLPRRCLSLPIDQWQTDAQTVYNPNPESVGSRYNVVLRSADRLNCSSQMKALWKKKWSGLEKNKESPAVQWLVCGDNQEPDTLSKDLSSDQAVGWHCFQPPPPVAPSNPCSFSVMVGSGAPVAIWLRQALPNSEQEFSLLLNNCFSTLPASVACLRTEAFCRSDKSSAHLGENIGLIWDDPKLVPPGVVKPKRLRIPA